MGGGRKGGNEEGVFLRGRRSFLKKYGSSGLKDESEVSLQSRTGRMRGFQKVGTVGGKAQRHK